jgi:glutaredoxin
VGRTYYTFVDAAGSIRMVDRLDEVPATLRARAKRIDVAPAAAKQAGRDAGVAREAPGSVPTGNRFAHATPTGRAAATPTVVIYTAKWCGWCRAALAHLDERGVPYVNRDIEDDPDAPRDLRHLTGGTSVPVLEIDGQLVRGFDVARIDALLDGQAAARP